MTAAGGSVRNPYHMADWSDPLIQQMVPYFFFPDLTTYAKRPNKLTPGENTGVFMVAGQSNAVASAVGASFVPTNAAKVDTFDITNGDMLEGKDPGAHVQCIQPVGSTSWLYKFADKLITAGKYQRVIMVPAAIGATSSSVWTTGGSAQNYHSAIYRRLRDIGIPITAVLWQNGETDGVNGMSTAQYKANVLAMIANLRAAGCNAPWFLAKSTMQGVVHPTIRDAIDQAVNGVDILAGPDSDTLTGAYRDSMTMPTHFSDSGTDANATLWKNALLAVL